MKQYGKNISRNLDKCMNSENNKIDDKWTKVKEIFQSTSEHIRIFKNKHKRVNNIFSLGKDRATEKAETTVDC